MWDWAKTSEHAARPSSFNWIWWGGFPQGCFFREMVGVCGLELNPKTNSSSNLAGSSQTWTLLSPLDPYVQPGHPYLSLSIPNRENFEATKYEKSLATIKRIILHMYMISDKALKASIKRHISSWAAFKKWQSSSGDFGNYESVSVFELTTPKSQTLNVWSLYRTKLAGKGP